MSKALANKARISLALAVSALALGGCGWFGSDKDKPYVETPVEILYNRALDDLGQQDYKLAAKEFEEVDRQHPYSVWATKAQIMAAFTYYQANKYDDAIIALDRFIQLHPGHKDIPYAYYLKGLCFYEQISDVGRDQRITQQALDALAEVVKRYPDTPYARDARLKVELTIDHLAGKEMLVGRYYQKQQQFVGAINRFGSMMTFHFRSSSVPVFFLDPWRFQYFEHVPCPDHVAIPTDDPDSWELYPAHRWIYNKLLVAESIAGYQR